MEDFSREELDKIKASSKKLESSQLLASSGRSLRFIRYLVEATLNGTENKLNQAAIAIDVFDRDATFDSAVDSVVRVEAGRLRNKLREYYESAGRDDPVRCELPKGSYRLKLHFETSPGAAGQPAPAAQATQNATKKAMSIAVLPFELLSNNPDDEILADTVATEIIDQLGRSTLFDSVSRRSSFAYKDSYGDIRQIAEALKVNHVLEGSLRRSGTRLRLSVALIDGKDGRQVWSQLYDHEEGSQLNLETQIAQKIVASLICGSWRIAAETSVEDQPDLVINNQSLKLMFNFSQRNCQLGKKLALDAILQQPNAAEIYGVLAFHSMQEYINCWSATPEQTRLEGIASATRAIDLDSCSYWAQWGAAVAFEWLGEPFRALMIMESAIMLHPDDFILKGFYGHTLLHVNRVEEGLQVLQQAIDSGPVDHRSMPPFYVFSCVGYTLLGKYEEAIAAGEKAFHVMMSSSASNALFYTNALALAGYHDKAREMLAQARRISPNMSLPYFKNVCTQTFDPPSVSEQLFAGLEQLDWK